MRHLKAQLKFVANNTDIENYFLEENALIQLGKGIKKSQESPACSHDLFGHNQQ